MRLWLLIACPAEQLGIDLPRGGPGAISHDDLRHDVPILVASPEATFVHRMGQMQFVSIESADGLVCARRGEGNPITLVATWPASADEATAAAALISMGKAWDLSGGPKRQIDMCIRRQGAVGHIDIGALAAGPLIESGGRFSSGTPDPATPAEGVDFKALQDKVRQILISIESRPLSSTI